MNITPQNAQNAKEMYVSIVQGNLAITRYRDYLCIVVNVVGAI
jgi:hypothetical protein